jgi:hypothetical protein
VSPVNLAAQPSNAPLPVGVGIPKRAASGGTIAYPGAGNYIVVSGDAQVGPFQRTYRFWLCAAAFFIYYSPGAWTRYDYILSLLVNGAYNPDLNGIQYFQKANSGESTGHADPWLGADIEGKFFCEANTQYYVRLLSQSNNGGSYYQSPNHINMYAYTVGEGVY